MVNDIDCRTTERSIQQPTLQLYADQDGAFTAGMFELCSVANSVDLIKIHNCSHWAQQDCPEIVNEHIENFTRKLFQFKPSS